MAADVIILNAILTTNADLRSKINGTISAGGAWASCPTNTALWAQIPRLTGGTSFEVCGTDSYFRCGATCTWTVPAGATIAQFQMWGSGSGTSGGHCCGTSPFGDTGAYAIAIIPVTAGCVYSICSGCAYCCCAYCYSDNSAGGCASYVTGHNLTGVCAEGGYTNWLPQTMQDLHGTACCRYQALGRTVAGPCICRATWMCGDGSCSSCGDIPINASLVRTYRGNVAATGFFTGLPSFHSGGCINTSHYGYMISAPVITSTHGSTGCCCAPFSSGSCCGGWLWSYSNCNYFGHPGLGGAYTHMMGGSTQHWGDDGRKGMVKVTYC